MTQPLSSVRPRALSHGRRVCVQTERRNRIEIQILLNSLLLSDTMHKLLRLQLQLTFRFLYTLTFRLTRVPSSFNFKTVFRGLHIEWHFRSIHLRTLSRASISAADGK